MKSFHSRVLILALLCFCSLSGCLTYTISTDEPTGTGALIATGAELGAGTLLGLATAATTEDDLSLAKGMLSGIVAVFLVDVLTTAMLSDEASD